MSCFLASSSFRDLTIKFGLICTCPLIRIGYCSKFGVVIITISSSTPIQLCYIHATVLSFWSVVYQFKYVALVFSKNILYYCFQLTAFPTGGFSHSVGFESATKHGFVTDFSKYLTQTLSAN